MLLWFSFSSPFLLLPPPLILLGTQANAKKEKGERETRGKKKEEREEAVTPQFPLPLPIGVKDTAQKDKKKEEEETVWPRFFSPFLPQLSGSRVVAQQCFSFPPSCASLSPFPKTVKYTRLSVTRNHREIMQTERRGKTPAKNPSNIAHPQTDRG